ncbi:reverse transcriptase-like protein [Salinadaptatus halalkaliphilus]|uniref:Reverse transcriptase-like protein n=1 Tax=Salinadaptatus halalkaliphilus TaxID=2419781 RepID=A0A4V3VKZ1_9EURY|nr:ribonuclease HI [Salinadaptatus halalkaliphilus]THE63567.1 reverse transcriptase-like protein [Salinadaptatus halalkaliphilus]
MPVIECDIDAARNRLDDAGVSVETGNTDHERWRASRGGATAVAYDDKIVVQGNAPQNITALLRESGGRAHVYFDGAARGNPGEAAIGWVIVTGDGIVTEGSERIGRATNNQAEYEALIAALEAASDYDYDELHVRGDSELIVKQVRGEYDTNNPKLRERRVTVHELLGNFDEWTLEHVPREVNSRADELANEAFDDG